MSPIRLLVVEDDLSLQKFLAAAMRKHAYQVILASTGIEALSLARSHNPDMVLLDLGLPDMDGLEVLQGIRTWSKAPVVILSARNQDLQKVQALDAGADDYVSKPFSASELMARLRVAARHILRQDSPHPILLTGGLSVNLETRQVTKNGQEIHMTPLEYRLLAALAQRRGKVATHQQLLTEVWGSGQAGQTQYLHLYMRQLRQKLEDDPKRPRFLRTESGVGYRLIEAAFETQNNPQLLEER